MFCFECCGDHRDLHSFPRRRSSDLPWALFAGWVAGMASGTAMALSLGLKSSVYPLHLPSFLGGTYAMYAAVPALALNLVVSVDQKSTRLNSIHQIISYSVFSL